MEALLARTREGMEGIEDVDPRHVAAAVSGLRRWLSEPSFQAYRPAIEHLARCGRWSELLDAFHRTIPFGTGGRRGRVGPGPNRINHWTVATSIQGHAEWLLQRTRHPHVVIAHDVRRFLDARGLYDPACLGPLRRVSSLDFARLAACVYAANGIRAWMPVLTTPELSFAIRWLEADGGVNISASHNHPDDNGVKVYDRHGGQEVPPADQELAERIDSTTQVREMTWEDAVERGMVRELPSELRRAYIQANLACSRHPGARDVSIVFTPLHGNGDSNVGGVLRAADFRLELEPDQARPDGSFPTVPFLAPNPEVPESMDRAVRHARELGADIVLASDPDADRLGVVVRHEDGWRFLDGNEIAALVVAAVLAGRRSTPGAAPIVIKTEVTSRLVSRLARARGAQVVGHLPVGFKYIAEGLRQLEEIGCFFSASGGLADFAAGVEESHGVLVTPQVRDKDAAGAALVVCELAAVEKARGRTLVDLLHDIYREVGVVANVLLSSVMDGTPGRSRIAAIQASLRADRPRHVGGREVIRFHDRRDPRGPFGPLRSQTDAAARDVLVFELEGGARVLLRPSGTEPKNKIYAELPVPAGDDPCEALARARRDCRLLAEDFAILMLARVGFELPRWALRMSGLVPVEQKRLWVSEVIPAMVAGIRRGGSWEQDLRSAWSAWGDQGWKLFAPGIAAWLEEAGPDPLVAASVRRVFGLS